MRPAVEAERTGIPSVVITLTGFTAVAHLAAKAAGLANLRIAEYPGAIGVELPEIREKITKVLLKQIIDGLTSPTKVKSSGATNVRNPQEIVCRGNFEQVNKFFSDNEWTDGLPIIPPTMERVEKFLKFTDRSPDEEIAILPQANLRAIPCNIAANGIMAGCRPEHMPILMAAVEAMGDEHYNLNNIGTTWGIIPYLVVNGPIIKQLGIECAGQLISRGPNPAIGRALGLIIRNIAGYKPGKNQMGTFGYPLPFALAENEEQSPWEPFHVEHGFDRNVNTVTVGTTLNWGYPPSPYTRVEKAAGQTTVEMLCIEVTKKACLPILAERGPTAFVSEITFLLPPCVARSVADAGYTKQAVKEYVYENAKVPLREIEWLLRYALVDVKTVRQKVEEGVYPKEFLVGSDDLIRIVPSPDIIHVLVCGDPGRNRVKTLDTHYTRHTTKEIKLPGNWDVLLKDAK